MRINKSETKLSELRYRTPLINSLAGLRMVVERERE